MKTKFSDLQLDEAISLLTELGDGETVMELSSILEENPKYKNRLMKNLPDSVQIEKAKWRGTEHSYGYISIDSDGDNLGIESGHYNKPRIRIKR